MKRTKYFIIGLCAAVILSIPLISYAYRTGSGDVQGVVYMDGVGGLDNATVRLYSGPNESGKLMAWTTTATVSGIVGYYRFNNIPAASGGTIYYLSVWDNQTPKRFADNLSTPKTLYPNQAVDCHIKVTGNDGVRHNIYFADDYASFQDAIDACSAAGGGKVFKTGDLTLTSPITITTDNVHVEIIGNVTSQIQTDGLFVIGSASTNPQMGSIKVRGVIKGPETTSSILVRQISGKYWTFEFVRLSSTYLFGYVWKWDNVERLDKMTYFGASVMTVGGWAKQTFWYIPKEPENSRVEGNIMIAHEARSVDGKCILFEGGASNTLIGPAHSEAGVADIDDLGSRGRNSFLVHWLAYPDNTVKYIRDDSVLLCGLKSKIPTLWLPNTSFQNQVDNGSFEIGGSPNPRGWAQAGTYASFAQSSEQAKIGTYSGKLTRVGNDCWGYYAHPNYEYYKNRTVSMGAWVYATVANRARIDINDGLGYSYSDYHTGTPGWEWLTVTRTVNADATQLWAAARIRNGNTSAYFDGVVLVEGRSCPAFTPKPADPSNTNWGSSTGTGAQRPIAHGLAATPTKVRITPTSPNANAYISKASDATYIYITATSGATYDWEAEF